MKKNRKGWYGVDLDGTLAYYESGDFDKYGPYHIGKPIRKMVDRIIKHILDGDTVCIFTARITPQEGVDIEKVRYAIQVWCEKHIGYVLYITNVKDFDMIRLYDDRAIQIIANTGDRADGLE